jgi:muramoyltetrapeptide carboxypeptidase
MIDRRDFARLSALTAVTAAVSALAEPNPKPQKASKLLKPRRLSPGDTVELVLPATQAPDPDRIYLAKDQLEAIGFKVEIGRHAFEKYGYFAGRDRDRAEDINRAFADERIAAIICFTGGWGSPRVLQYLDYASIARNPKVIVGYSDITALINTIHQRTGLVTFHGPVGDSAFEPYSLDNFRRAVMTSEPLGLLKPPPRKPTELVDRANRILKLAPGKATGPLAGGNLSMVSSLMGTPWDLDTTGAILLLEDIHEEVYRIDRMLTQLWLGGKFERVAGIVFGRCTECDAKGPGFSLEEVLRDRLGSLGVPAISGLAFGHIEQKLTLPLGVPATVDADAGTLRIDEAAVV